MNEKAHIAHIDATIKELESLQSRTTSPAPLQHQYIGTIIDNTVCLLCSPANSLDNESPRFITFSDFNNWISVIQAVHRSFLSSIQIATEKALEEYCSVNGLTIVSSIKDEKEKEYLKFKASIPVEIEPKIAKFIDGILKGLKPGFNDYLNSALQISTMTSKRKKEWRLFFDGLSIIRNKVSHSDPTLNNNERDRLKKGGFDPLISDKGDLQFSTRNYLPISEFILNFFDELLNSSVHVANP